MLSNWLFLINHPITVFIDALYYVYDKKKKNEKHTTEKSMEVLLHILLYIYYILYVM